MRIAGPAHRRPGTLPLRRRHIWAWGAIAVGLIALAGQWVVSEIGDRTAERSGKWAGPPPGPWRPGVTVTTVTPTSSPSGTPSARPSRSPSVMPSSQPSHRTPPPTPHARRPAPARTPTARITAPRAGTKVAGGPGVLMRGTAAGLSGHELRIFDFAPNGVYYLADEGPIPVSRGRWSFRDATIGAGERDVGQPFVLTTVIADRACRTTLRSTPRDAENNISFRALPAGCHEADSVRVIKTAP